MEGLIDTARAAWQARVDSLRTASGGEAGAILRFLGRSLVDDLPARERGTLDGYRIGGGATELVRSRLEQARAWRSGRWVRVVPGWGRYLDGLIAGLEREVRRRE